MLVLQIFNSIIPKFDHFVIPHLPTTFGKSIPSQFLEDRLAENKGTVETHHFVGFRWSLGGIVGGVVDKSAEREYQQQFRRTARFREGWCGCVGLSRVEPRPYWRCCNLILSENHHFTNRDRQTIKLWAAAPGLLPCIFTSL